jgi:Family of unknown function (DUF6191)
MVGLLRWFRGEDDTATAMMSAGLAEIAGIFQPTRHKQTEHIDETTRRRVDVANGTGIDLDRGIAVIRLCTAADNTHPDPEPDIGP